MLNQCTFLGILTGKPKLRNTRSGKTFATFSIDVARERPDQDGKWINDTIDCVAWEVLAQKAFNKYDKGDPLIVSGRLQIRTQTDKDGNTIAFAEIYVKECRKLWDNRSRGFSPSNGNSEGTDSAADS